MIQFNLLPDVKLKYIKATRTRRNVIMASIATSIATLSLLLIMFVIANVLQPLQLKSANNKIRTKTNQLEAVNDLDKVLTVQNQLNSLTPLHDQKPITSRIFGFVGQLTPTQISISRLSVDLTANTIVVTGSADSLASVNKFTDTLKFTDYKTVDEVQNKAFSNVVLTNFTRSEKDTTYTLTFNYDPRIFAGDQEGTLIVPTTTSTRSTTEKPGELFQIIQPQTGEQ